MLQREQSLHVIINFSIRAKDEIEGWGLFGDNMAASHKRMEDMMRLILQNQGQKHPTPIDNITEPSSSTKMHDNFALTSTTVELAMLAPKQTCTYSCFERNGRCGRASGVGGSCSQ